MEDCIIVGAGPAGLTAAIYLARFHLAIRLFDCGSSRAALIPCTHNHAGFPEGISGPQLLARMAEQAERYGAQRELARVTSVDSTSDGFRVTAEGRAFAARAIETPRNLARLLHVGVHVAQPTLEEGARTRQTGEVVVRERGPAGAPHDELQVQHRISRDLGCFLELVPRGAARMTPHRPLVKVADAVIVRRTPCGKALPAGSCRPGRAAPPARDGRARAGT